MSVEKKSIIDKADVINFTVMSFVIVIIIIVFAQLIIAGYSGDPMGVLLDLRGWFIPLASGIFLAYGIIKGQNGGD